MMALVLDPLGESLEGVKPGPGRWSGCLGDMS